MKILQVIDTSNSVKNSYAYKPFDELHDTETEENIANPFVLLLDSALILRLTNATQRQGRYW